MFLDTENGRPTKLTVASTPLSMDEAVDRLRTWSKHWQFDLGGLPQWQREVGRGFLGNFAAGRFSREPGGVDVWLEIWPTIDRQRPCYVAFNVYWHSTGEQ